MTTVCSGLRGVQKTTSINRKTTRISPQIPNARSPVETEEAALRPTGAAASFDVKLFDPSAIGTIL